MASRDVTETHLSWPRRIGVGREIAWLLAMGAVALGVGLVVNALRGQPLPLRYQSKAERLAVAVAAVSGQSERPAVPVAAAGQIPHVTSDEVRAMMERGGVVLVDARGELFFRLGHLPGALSLPRDRFRMAYDEHRGVLGANSAGTIVVYCQSATCEDSTMVATALRDLGYGSVVILEGGWNGWKARGFANSTDQER